MIKSREGISTIGVTPDSWEKKQLRIDLCKDLREISPFSDTPSTKFKGPHFLFAGCSITAGESLMKEDSWSWKLYKELIKDSFPGDTFFNIACSGMSTTEAIDQVFKYCNNFGNPDAIFILFPDPFRDSKYCGEDDYASDLLKTLIYKSYFYLELFCKTNNIKLITSTWYKNLSEIDEEFLPNKDKKYYPGTTKERPDWSYQLNKNKINLLNMILQDFNTFKKYSEDDLTSEVMRYHVLKDGLEKVNSLVASDGLHPGTSFHDFWKDFFYKRYKEELNV